MAQRPEVTNIKEELALRGSGKLGNSYDYLSIDPVSYFYAKNKSINNPYLIDEMWTEAAKRGESSALISYLEKANDPKSDMSMFNKWNTYSGYNDYDGYMLAMAIPTLDDSVKKERKDEESGYSWGEYTDKEWATQILNSQFEGYEAKITEEKKATKAWYEKLGAYIASGTSHLVAGVTNFAQDLWNVGEGLLNMMVNWSGDENIGNRFLYAFSNDAENFEPFAAVTDWLQKSAYQWEYEYTSFVDAHAAWEAGYRPGESALAAYDAQNAGVSYKNKWGQYWASGIESIGYMLPTIVLAAATAGTSLGATTIGTTSVTVSEVASQAVFYTGIFSGLTKDTVTRATMNGISYKDLNAGEVILNAGLKAVAQLAIEQVLGKILGFSGLDKMLGATGGKAAGKGAVKTVEAATATGIKAAAKALGRGAKDMIKEGLEEFLQDSSDGLIDLCFGGDYYTRGMETLQISNLVDSFVVGALVSGVIGVVNNAKVVLPSNRGVGTNPDGSIYRMGFFQTLNYRQALASMNEWSETLHNPKAKEDAKIEAAFKISVAMDTIGSVLQSMGTDRAIQANNLLVADLDNKDKRNSAVTKLSNKEYASKLYEIFKTEHANAVLKYVEDKDKKSLKNKLVDKIVTALTDKADILKKKGVNRIETMVTDNIDPNDPNININASAAEKLKTTLKGLGADIIIGVDGNVITKSNQVVFVDNRLVQAGDVEEIIRGIAYEQVQAAVTTKLTPSQKKLLTNSYFKVTGIEGTIDDAITALLFDKNFYTYVLLAQSERTRLKPENKLKAIEMLATIDKLVKAKVSPEVAAGRVTEAAYKTLMKKVQDTMRTGLVTFATQYVKLDLGNISNDILSPEVKEVIKNHRNVRFTEFVNEGLSKDSPTVLAEERISRYDEYIDKFSSELTAEEIKAYKTAARSKNYNDRVDAYTILQQLTKSYNLGQNIDDDTKLVYLPSSQTNYFATQAIDYLEKFFGVSWIDLAWTSNETDRLDISKISSDAKIFAEKNGYNLKNRQSRLACLRELIYLGSNKQLTLDNNFLVIRSLTKDEFLKPEYSTTEALYEALKKGPLTLQDISKVELNSLIKDIKIVLDINQTQLGLHNNKIISVNGVSLVNTILHEATHATQDALAANYNEIVAGGSERYLNRVTDKTISEIEKYIKDTFPLSYDFFKSHYNISPRQLIYFMLAGELQANSSFGTYMFESGFKWNTDRTKLISPDGTKTWQLDFKSPDTESEFYAQGLLDAISRKGKTTNKKKSSSTNQNLQNNIKPTKLGFSEEDAPITKSSEDAPITKKARYISNKVARESNLKYWIRKGKPIQIDPGVAAFVVSTTKDFDKLPKVLRDLIKAGSLTKFDILEYTATASRINDYTFKAIAEYAFNNTDLAQLTHKDMLKLMDNIGELSALAGFLYNKDKYLTDYIKDKLANVSKEDKLEAIKDYISKRLTAETLKLPVEKRVAAANKILSRKKSEFAKLKTLTTTQIDDRYLQATGLGEQKKLLGELGDIDQNVKMSPEEMLALIGRIQELMKNNELLSKAWAKELKKAGTIKVETAKGNTAYVEEHADTKQLNLAFFKQYHGSLSDMRDINNLGKVISSNQHEFSLYENTETGEIKGASKKTWNWIDKKRVADIDYEIDDDVKETIESISREEKLETIKNYIYETIAARAEKLSDAERKASAKAIVAKTKSQVEQLKDLSEEALNKRYIFVLTELAGKGSKLKKKIESVITITESEKGTGTFKNAKDKCMNVAATLTRRMAGLKTNYNNMPEELKQYFNAKTFTMSRASLKGLTIEQINVLHEKIKAYSKKLTAIQKANARRLKAEETNERLLKEGKTKVPKKPKTKGEITTQTKPKTLREKVEYVHTTKIKEHEFEVASREPSNSLVQNMLNTAWDKGKKTQVQGLSNNTDDNVANANEFYKQNAEFIMQASLGDVEQAVRFFMEARLSGVDTTSTDFRKFQAVKMYFLGYVLGETGQSGIFAGLNPNLKSRIENTLRNEMSTAGTLLSIWNNIKNIVDPTKAMASASMEIDGVPLTDAEKTELFDAAKSSDIERIKSIQDKIINRILAEKTGKRSIFRKISTVRSMSMLSSPVTWLRNLVSNIVVKRVNKLSSAIGNNIWRGKTVSGQLKLTSAVTPEIQSFINKHFIDNKLFDTIVLNLSKYNPSEISTKNKTVTGQASKEAIFAQMVVKSMYNQYYNENLFKSKWMNDVHGLLMKALSDNNYVREAAIRYFGKIIAEKGYDLSTDTVNDNVMNDFAVAIGLALSDYMHSDNIMHRIEAIIQEKGGEGALFAWKLALPFAASSWSWFKAALKLSPLGLGRAIYNMAKLENRVVKAEAAWAEGKSQLSPELTEYIARRDLGAGIIGTIAWGLGILLASFGWIRLEDDDYGIPKLCIGNLKIDVSSIFGSSSLLAGAALITGIQDNGVTWSGIVEGLSRSSDVLFEDLFLLDIVRLDMYGESVTDMLVNNLESIALSFIPNLVSWLAGFTYTGNLNKKTFWGKAAAKIPFLGALVNEKKVDPYTGSQGDLWDTFNRVVPYFSVEISSEGEKLAKSLGLNKSELRGQYNINGEEFNLNAKQVNELNQAYGSWNATAIADFYQNNTSVTLKVGDTYKTMKYNQMTDEQRKTAVQQIMQTNATYAKIKAWTEAGNKYYASATEYAALRKLGITKNIFRGTQGYVSKKN